MHPTPPPLRTVRAADWFVTYFIGVTALALVLTILLMLLMLSGAGTVRWTEISQMLFMGLMTLVVSGLVIGILTALPCALFFWLAHRFAWRNVLIYLFCGAVCALPTIPLVMSLAPDSYIDLPEQPPEPGFMERYSPMAPLFGGSGAFLGAIFWWRSGRHLR